MQSGGQEAREFLIRDEFINFKNIILLVANLEMQQQRMVNDSRTECAYKRTKKENCDIQLKA